MLNNWKSCSKMFKTVGGTPPRVGGHPPRVGGHPCLMARMKLPKIAEDYLQFNFLFLRSTSCS